MLNPLKYLRYFVFAVFIICNAIITSVAVWNLSIVQVIATDVAAKEISSYLIFLGASGLIIVFTVLFVELDGNDVFLGKVWFEVLWVGLFLIMELAGAAAITAQSNGQICDTNILVSPCVSTQVLQASTWVCAILLFGYFTLFFVVAIMEYQDDYSIWRCSMRKFPWLSRHHARKSVPVSSASLPRFRTQVPIIAAPRPRRVIATPEALLAHRSGLSPEYEIEYYQPPAAGRVTSSSSSSPVGVSPAQALLQPQQASQKPGPIVSTPFYPAHVQTAISPGPPSTARMSQVRRLPPAPSPPPLGDWPRRDATSQPARVKRKPVPQNAPPALVPYSFTIPVAVQQSEPLAPPPTRSRPSGPRRRSNSGENQRPPNVNLSNFNSSHTRGYS